MKYVKLLWLDTRPGGTIAQCFDVPVNMLIPVSVAGEFTDNSIKVESKYYFDVNNAKHSVGAGQIIGLCVNKAERDLGGESRFSYLYDVASRQRVLIGDLNAFSWGELMIKMTIAGLVYSTDGEIMEVPEALKTVMSQKHEMDVMAGRIDILQSDLAALQEKIRAKDETIAQLEARLAAPPSEEKPKKSWKKMFESIFGSKDSLSYEE